MIEAHSITKKYGNFLAIDRLSFQIQPGEVVGLLGPNGAGKTTTLRILTGFLPPTSGEVKVGGFDLSKHPSLAKSRLGYLPENPPLYPELTVEENLVLVAGLRKIPSPQRKEKIRAAMQKTGITDMQRRPVGNLSKGYRQRVGIAQAILHDPPFLILDEPTIGLDPKQILEIRELIRNLKGDRAILLSSHILQEVTLVCDRIIIIHRGNIVADGKIGELTDRLEKKRCLVTIAKGRESVRDEIAKVPGVESVIDHPSDLEELFLTLTQENR